MPNAVKYYFDKSGAAFPYSAFVSLLNDERFTGDFMTQVKSRFERDTHKTLLSPFPLQCSSSTRGKEPTELETQGGFEAEVEAHFEDSDGSPFKIKKRSVKRKAVTLPTEEEEEEEEEVQLDGNETVDADFEIFGREELEQPPNFESSTATPEAQAGGRYSGTLKIPSTSSRRGARLGGKRKAPQASS